VGCPTLHRPTLRFPQAPIDFPNIEIRVLSNPLANIGHGSSKKMKSGGDSNESPLFLTSQASRIGPVKSRAAATSGRRRHLQSASRLHGENEAKARLAQAPAILYDRADLRWRNDRRVGGPRRHPTPSPGDDL
jgi:hypothetical protein